jgi:hypothetical protein
LSGAKSGALSTDLEQFDSDLQCVIAAWPTLPEAIHAGILSMIEAALTSTK